MSRIRGAHTSPERLLRRALWQAGVRYRLHLRTPHGRPDLVLARHRVAIFIDGCFWHGCPEHYVYPRTQQAFWLRKLSENVERDCAQTRAFELAGWRVCRLWEHEIFEDPAAATHKVLTLLQAKQVRPVPVWRVIRVETADAEGRRERRYLRELRGLRAARVVLRVRTTHKWSRAKDRR
jgi:DNA mismatch endonuclease (patch repair protein)